MFFQTGLIDVTVMTSAFFVEITSESNTLCSFSSPFPSPLTRPQIILLATKIPRNYKWLLKTTTFFMWQNDVNSFSPLTRPQIILLATKIPRNYKWLLKTTTFFMWQNYVNSFSVHHIPST